MYEKIPQHSLAYLNMSLIGLVLSISTSDLLVMMAGFVIAVIGLFGFADIAKDWRDLLDGEEPA